MPTIESTAELGIEELILSGAGAVTKCAIRKADDPNTGIIFPAADEIALVANGVQIARATASGLILPQLSANLFVRSGTITDLTLVGSTTAGSPTYVTRSAAWRRIGPLVHVGFEVNISDLGGLEGNVSIGNVLPFAALNATGYFSPANIRPSNIGLTTNYTSHTLQTAPDSTSLFLQQTGNNVAAANVGHALMANTSRILGGVTYITAAA